MKAEYEGIHPDEGTIHAWLDDALDAADAERIAAHVESCVACADRVAEARGLIAGASRVVRLLDDAPAPMLAPSVVPAAATPVTRWLRVTPARAAIAATLIVAVGLTLTRDKVAEESAAIFADSAPVMMTPAASAPVADASVPEEAKAKERDTVLASAITRRIREETPQRTIGGASGVAVPTAPPPTVVASEQAANMAAASRKVAVGRDSIRLSEVTVTASSADKVQARAPGVATSIGAGCYRLESRDGGGAWGGVPLPTEIALATTPVAAPTADARADSVGRAYAITPAAGGAAIGSWTRAAGDSIALELRSSFATTTGVVVGSSSSLSGTLNASSRDAIASAPARAEMRQRQSPAAGASSAVTSTVRITMRAIACPR